MEQENWMSSPLMRQALSSRDTNLGGAGGVRRAVRPAAINNYKNSCEIAVITGNWFEVEEAEEEAEENKLCQSIHNLTLHHHLSQCTRTAHEAVSKAGVLPGVPCTEAVQDESARP